MQARIGRAKVPRQTTRIGADAMQGSDLDRLDRPRLLIVRGLGLEEHEHLLVPWANRLLGTELDR
jgi:hypothetical protein